MRYPDQLNFPEIPNDVYSEESARQALELTTKILDIVKSRVLWGMLNWTEGKISIRSIVIPLPLFPLQDYLGFRIITNCGCTKKIIYLNKFKGCLKPAIPVDHESLAPSAIHKIGVDSLSEIPFTTTSVEAWLSAKGNLLPYVQLPIDAFCCQTPFWSSWWHNIHLGELRMIR